MFISLLTTLVSCISCFGGTCDSESNFLVEERNYQEATNLCQSIADEEGIENPENGIHTVKDLSGNIFYVKLGKEEGIAIIDLESGSFLELSLEMTSPYDFTKNGDYYYFGPMNYFERKGDYFYSLTDDNHFDLSFAYQLQETFDEGLQLFRESVQSNSDIDDSDVSLLTTTDSEGYNYINNYEYIKYGGYPSNVDGSCGYVSAALVLHYWDQTMHEGTVPSEYKGENGELTDTGKTKDIEHNLKDKLINYIDDSENPKASSTGRSVSKALNAFCSDYGINGKASWGLFGTGAVDELKADRPVILFGRLPNASSFDGSYVNHAVVAYGYKKSNGSTYYVTNYCWNVNGMNYVEVIFAPTLLGTTCKFQLNDYEASYTISPSDYGFPGNYNGEEIVTDVSKGNLTFSTTRLRTGYIENEYINLSPRREGYGTAYLEYDLVNPVTSIDVNLSFWSSDERYYTQDNPEARLEYKELCGEEWIEALDLLNCNLPTDRYNQSTYKVEFEAGTRCFRFYTNFESMSGYTDRNKGRICIGDMTIYTYD
ncbi:MAG: C39 family peptidase [Coprobacillus sp.]|nr:C39 family peptidase [Coprobacillus sp.]